jgi:hypothetical protein
MRAYHQSEISHANDAITMLLAIAGAAGAVVLAILFPPSPPNHVHQVAWGLFIAVLLFSLAVGGAAHIKIASDHRRYADFGKEYVETCKRLGFYETDERGVVKNTSLKTNLKIGEGQGYQKTQCTIWAFALVLSVLALVFAVLVGMFL